MNIFQIFKEPKKCFVLVLVLFSYSLIKGVRMNDVESNQTNELKDKHSCEQDSTQYSTLLIGVLSTLVFCLVGVFPALFIRSEEDVEKFKNSMFCKFLLAFAAGSLLGDIFFHLLPEASQSGGGEERQIKTGLNIICAFMLFLTIEKITGLIPNARALGALNLIANLFDNGSHATTVVGSFQVSATFGLIALLATVIHEVPHEMSDFALLIRDGYTRNKAITFQLITAFTGAIAATFAYAFASTKNVCTNSTNHYLEHHQPAHHMHTDNETSFILPFTIGGFLYIALVGIIPEIVEEEEKKTSLMQLVSMTLGIFFIYALVQIESILPTYFLVN